MGWEMSVSGAARSVTYLAVAVAAFVVVLLVLPEPVPSEMTEDAGPDARFAIVDVLVFDGQTFRPHQDVWVENGRIRRVGEGIDLPEDLDRVVGRGRTLVPGLIDGHVHTFGSTLNDAVRFGVTTVFDQFTDPRLIASKRVARHELARGNEADLFSAGMAATAAGGHGTQFGVQVETLGVPTEALGWVQARKAEGSDWIKIMYEDGSAFGGDYVSLTRETVGALIAAAHDEGLRVVVHVSTLEHALDAVALGADGLAHVWGDKVVDEVQASRIAEAEVFVVTTLSVLHAIGGDIEREGLDAGDRLLSPMQRQSLSSRFSRGSRPSAFEPHVPIENVRRLHAAGVRLIAGTDAPNPGTASGLSLHGELQMLMQAGLSSAEALAAATLTPAQAFGLDDRGGIDEGRIADLVLVDGDLESDLALSTRLVAIWKDGYRVERRVGAERLPVAVSGAPEATLLADFADGIGARGGVGWQATTDGMRGGSSVARLSAERGTLRVEGEIVEGFALFLDARRRPDRQRYAVWPGRKR